MMLPYSRIAEEHILGGILIDEGCLDRIADKVKPHDFHSERHRVIYEAMLKLKERGVVVDYVTLTDALDGQLDKIGGTAYITSLTDKIATISNIEHYIEILKEKSTRRNGIQICQRFEKLLSSPGEDPSEMINTAQSELMQLILGESKTLYNASELASESLGKCQAMAEAKDSLALSTGIRDLDNLLGGGFHDDFIVLAGRPKQGKTALECSIIANQALSGRHVGIVAIEPHRLEIVNRIVSRLSGVNLLKFRSGRFSPDEWQRVVECEDKIARWSLSLEDPSPGIAVEEVLTKARLMRRIGVEIIFIDQLSKIQGKGKTLTESYSNVVNRLSQLPKELSIPIVLLCQINREPMNEKDQRPQLHHLKQTGSLEEDADVVLLLYREFEYTRCPDQEYEALLDVAAHRHGPTGDLTLRWHPRQAYFEDGGPR